MPAFSVSRLIEPMLIPLLFIGYGGKIQVMEELCFKRAPAGSHGGRSVQSVPAQGICCLPCRPAQAGFHGANGQTCEALFSPGAVATHPFQTSKEVFLWRISALIACTVLWPACC